MSGFDDPRFVEQQFKALKKEVDDLKRVAVPFTVQQKGPIPGAMRAVQINDQGQASSMWANYTNAGPGKGPYSAVTDSAGVIRAEWGNLAANGVSPAQFGFRANTASGPIFDSLGLISVMNVLGSVSNVSQSNVTGNGSWQTVSGSTISFSLTRTTSVLVLGAGTIVDPTVGDTGFNLTNSLLVDGSPAGPTFAPGTSSFTATPWVVTTLSGSHNVSMGVNQTNTHLWTAIGVYVTVFQLGS